MQTLKKLAGILGLTLLSLSMAYAETPADAEVIDNVEPPPKVIEGEPLPDPDVTIRKNGEDQVEEYSINGEVYMVRVIPKNGKPYYLHKNAEGHWIHDGANPPLSVPSWVIFRF